jgi:hypothetical protein
MKQIIYMTIYTHAPKKMKKKLSLEMQNISYEDRLKGAEGSKDDRTLEREADLVWSLTLSSIFRLGMQHQVYPVRDDEVLVDSKEIESKPDLRKDQMKRQLLGLEDRCREKTRS